MIDGVRVSEEVERLQLVKDLGFCSGWCRHRRVDDGSFLLKRKMIKENELAIGLLNECMT